MKGLAPLALRVIGLLHSGTIPENLVLKQVTKVVDEDMRLALRARDCRMAWEALRLAG